MKIIVESILSLFISYGSWNFIPNLELSQIQYIASTISTISGILLGFVIASITILASAKDNTLVKNTAKTGFLQTLVSKLNRLMVFLFVGCLIFLSSLFINTTYMIYGDIKLVSIIILIGVFVFSLSIFRFIEVWKQFSKFASLL